MNKLIGVTPRLLTEGTTIKEFVNKDYITSLTSRGLNVIMLTIESPNIEQVLSLCDGFLVTGGSDVDPKWFNEENCGSKGVDSDLDYIDKVVIEYAVKNKKPLLGICRGHQTINVFLGGSLFQDIGDTHTSIKENHSVITTPNSYLQFEQNMLVNSYHHQAVKRVAPNMKPIAWHTDGTIEAIIHDYLPIIGIQWHPERLQSSQSSKTIFDKFVSFINAKN